MKLEINDSKKLHEIQEEFHARYPYLKIEFFTLPHLAGGGSEKENMLETNKTLQDCRTVHFNGNLEIQPEMTVTNLEKSFQNMFGLSVQVFRKSGKVWLETTTADHWTLTKHNEMGELSMKEVID